MDADDIALKDRLKEQVHFIENNKEVDVVGSNILLIGQDGKELKCRQFDENNSSISKKLKMPNYAIPQ